MGEEADVIAAIAALFSNFRIKPLIRMVGKRRHRPVAARAVLACKSEARSEARNATFVLWIAAGFDETGPISPATLP
jgi:hypothetical protein